MAINNAAADKAMGIPVVKCIVRRRREGWACDIWVIERCPFCDQRHSPGGGEGDRTSHCAERDLRGTYYLTARRKDK